MNILKNGPLQVGKHLVFLKNEIHRQSRSRRQVSTLNTPARPNIIGLPEFYVPRRKSQIICIVTGHFSLQVREDTVWQAQASL